VTDRWRQQLGHDGRVRIRLRLLSPGEGGRDRALQTGFKAEWLLPDDERPAAAPIDLVGGRRSLRPGDEAVVVAHPLEPERWHDLAVGTSIDLFWSRGRRLGVGVVEAVEDVPDHPVPPRPVDLDPHLAALARRAPGRRGRPHPGRRLRRAS
jgi:hypothetical protein